MLPWYLRDDGITPAAPVLVRLESRAAIERSLADEVFAQLAQDYPKASLEWVHHTAWEAPRLVPFAALDMRNKPHWRAFHEPDRVAEFSAKIKQRLAKGKTQLKKPAVVVYEPGRPAQGLIIDGHHRTLGAEGAGEDGVLAWVGHTREVGGPWMELHDLQFTRESGSAPHSGDDDADDQVNGKGSRPAVDDAENLV